MSPRAFFPTAVLLAQLSQHTKHSSAKHLPTSNSQKKTAFQEANTQLYNLYLFWYKYYK